MCETPACITGYKGENVARQGALADMDLSGGGRGCRYVTTRGFQRYSLLRGPYSSSCKVHAYIMSPSLYC